MKILQVGTLDKVGGAAKASFRIKQELDRQKIENWLLVAHKTEPNADVLQVKPNLFQKMLHRFFLTEGLGRNSFKDLAALPMWSEIDLIHFNNLHGGYFNLLDLPRISRAKSCIWTLHDPWVLSNREKLVPEYRNIFPKDSFFLSILKHRAVNNSKITLVTPSDWLRKKVVQEFADHKVITIPLGVDLKTFKPEDKRVARRQLGLPLDKKIVLFVCNGGKDNLDKGSQYIENIRKKMPNQSFLFLALGDSKTYVSDEKTLVSYYAASDVLLFPSLADNLPLTIMESLACGTPAVAFCTGGIPEMIDHKINGYLAEYKNESDLLDGLLFVINHQNYERLSQAARKKSMDKYDIKGTVKKYFDLYHGEK